MATTVVVKAGKRFFLLCSIVRTRFDPFLRRTLMAQGLYSILSLVGALNFVVECDHLTVISNSLGII